MSAFAADRPRPRLPTPLREAPRLRCQAFTLVLTPQFEVASFALLEVFPFVVLPLPNRHYRLDGISRMSVEHFHQNPIPDIQPTLSNPSDVLIGTAHRAGGETTERQMELWGFIGTAKLRILAQPTCSTDDRIQDAEVVGAATHGWFFIDLNAQDEHGVQSLQCHRIVNDLRAIESCEVRARYRTQSPVIGRWS